MNRFADVAMVAARLATGRMSWQPDIFWNATPAEFRTAVEGQFGLTSAFPMTAAELERLQKRIPDER